MILSLARSPSSAGMPLSDAWYTWKGRPTSLFSRIKQRPPATDLSGPKASAESLTPRRNSPTAADAVDFQFDSFLPPLLGSFLLGEGPPWAGSMIAKSATFVEETIRGEKTGIIFLLTVGFPVIDRWGGCRWINLDDILAFAVVLLLTGSTFHCVLSL